MAPQSERSDMVRTIPQSQHLGGFSAADLPVTDKRPDSADTTSTLSDYCLKWLFDPHRRDHLPIEEQLQYYRQRDLRKVKVYKLASSLWGAPESRKRRIIAPPMEKVANQRDVKTNSYSAPSLQTNSVLQPQKPRAKEPTPEEIEAKNEEEKKEKYKNWMAERKRFRSDLDNMGLSERWLAHKPDRTALEQRLLKQMIDKRTPKKVTPPAETKSNKDFSSENVEEYMTIFAEPAEDENAKGSHADDSPTVKRPSPHAIGIIERFLREKRMRLIDLFSATDKDKSWTLTRAEFKAAVQQAKIPLSDVMLEDLVLALDHDMNDELDYRELARGMGLWKKERREARRRMAITGVRKTPSELARLSGYESPLEAFISSYQTPDSTIREYYPADHREEYARGEFECDASSRDRRESGSSPAPRSKSAVSNISSGSSQYLEPPDQDLRPEQKILSSEEAMVDLRKRDRAALVRLRGKGAQTPKSSQSRRTKRKPSPLCDNNAPIKTGDATIDGHSTLSTLGGETGAMVDKFRQLKLKEYNDIVKLCKLNNVPLTEDLLKRVLLYPPDRLPGQIKKKIRQPGKTLISQTFADPPKRPKTPIQQRLKDRIKVSKGSQLLMDSRHAYPNSYKCEAIPSRMNLSTGKALVSRQVDCWMTFEEYDRLTKHLAVRYSKLHGHTDDNVFWPGHLLDKIRLYMPHREPTSSAVFTQVKPTKKAYPQQVDHPGAWKISDYGYIQYGN